MANSDLPTSTPLLHKLAQANQFDLAALETNRDGRIAPSQRSQLLKNLGVIVLIVLTALAAIYALGSGFAALGERPFTALLLPCGSGIALLALYAFLHSKMRAWGGERIYNDQFSGVIKVLLLPADLLSGQVESVAGPTTRHKDRNLDSSGKHQAKSRYFHYYGIPGYQFAVSQEAYEAFPEDPLPCVIYYLPRSKAIINLEIQNMA